MRTSQKSDAVHYDFSGHNTDTACWISSTMNFKKCIYRNACKTSARKYCCKQNKYYFTVAFSMNPDLSMFSCLQKIKLKWIFILLMSDMQRGIGNHDTSNPEALNFGWILYGSSFFLNTIINMKYQNTWFIYPHDLVPIKVSGLFWLHCIHNIKWFCFSNIWITLGFTNESIILFA